MSKFKGKRMVDEDLIKKLEDLDPSGGTEYTAGDGISIDDDVLSVNYGTGLTVDDETLVVDSSTVAMKTDLATVATTGAYSDLSGTPTIPEAPLILTESTGTLSDEDYAKLDENTVIQYTDTSDITRLFYFKTETDTRFEYITNPMFTNSVWGQIYLCYITKADKSYNLNISQAARLLPTPTEQGTSKLTASRSGSTVSAPTWKLDYPDPDTSTAGSYNLEATVDAQGGVTYDWAAGGSGSSYTFTDGLTESSGTVSWDLNNNIIHNTNPVSSGIVSNDSIEIKADTGSNGVSTYGMCNLAMGYTGIYGKIISGVKDESGAITYPSIGNVAFGAANGGNEYSYGQILSTGSGSVAFGKAGSGYATDDGIIQAKGQSGATCVAFGSTLSGSITANYAGVGCNMAGGTAQGITSKIESKGMSTIAFGISGTDEGDILSSGTCSIAVGRGVQATGFDSIALGYKSTSSGAQSEAHGFRTKASGAQQFVIGKDNIEDSAGTYAFIIGNGTADNARSNAMTVSKDGTIVSKNLPAVSGTDGTYQLTATTSSGTTTYSWAAGGSGGKYLHKVKIYANFGGTQMFWTEDFVSSSATAYTSVSSYLTDRGYTVTSVSDQPTKSLDTYATSSITALAYRDTFGYVTSQLTINSSGVITYGSWATQSDTPIIQDEVIAL